MQSLVIPPELGERGEEKISTAKLVVQGKVSDYERASKKGANSQVRRQTWSCIWHNMLPKSCVLLLVSLTCTVCHVT